MASYSDRAVYHRYWRPHLLPAPGRFIGKASEGIVTNPHGRTLNSQIVGALRTIYYSADFILGHWLIYAPAVRSGGLVVVERGWQDLLVDPNRYLLRGTWLVEVLSPFFPRVDITVVLQAPPAVILQRKQELSEDEVSRQCSKWASIARSRLCTIRVDAVAPVAEIVANLRSKIDALI